MPASMASVKEKQTSNGKSRKGYAKWEQMKVPLLEKQTKLVWALCEPRLFKEFQSFSECKRLWNPVCFHPEFFPAWPSQSILEYPLPHSWLCKPSHLSALGSHILTDCLVLHPSVLLVYFRRIKTQYVPLLKYHFLFSYQLREQSF